VDPARKTDFTQLAMEREAYLFQAGIALALSGGFMPAARAEAQALLGDPARARATILARGALGVYAAAPEGVGGRPEDLGFSERGMQSLHVAAGIVKNP